jgi:hypothetical protein
MGDAAEDFAQAAMEQAATGAGGVISARVEDVTASGRVNLDLNGQLLLEVACADSYRDRAADDWVAVRMGARPVVMWRLGDDPAAADQARMQALAEDALDDMQVIRAATYGTGAPTGTGWQQATETWVRKVSGKLEVYFKIGDASDPSPGTPPTRPPKTVTISPSDSGSWRGGRPDAYRNNPYQGDYSGRGNLRGGWFYGTAIAAACSGKTVSSMKVSLTRKSGAGDNGRRSLHLYLHGYTSAPGGDLNLGDGPEELLSLSVGAKGSATLPAAWRSQLASGSARGLAIYARGSRDYMSVTGGQITITFSA